MFKFKQKRIYLDNAATTPTDRRVKKAIDDYSRKSFGNPSSLHKEGVVAKEALDNARGQVADFLNARSDEIVFTSGGTEANNLAILGVFEISQFGGPTSNLEVGPPNWLSDYHAITSVIEHASVLDTFKYLESKGLNVTYVGVNDEGVVDVKEVKDALRKETILVSIMYVNNEIGSIQPVREIAKVVRNFRKINEGTYPVFHIDATQALNYLDTNVSKLGVQLLSGSGSKIYGTKGAGFLFVKKGTPVSQIIHGGGQENGLRAGTENVTACVGTAEALKITSLMKDKEFTRLSELRDYFHEELKKDFPDCILNSGGDGLPNIVSVIFPNYESEELVLRLDAKGISCAGKSACSEGGDEDSHVISAMRKGASVDGVVRFSMGRFTEKSDIDYTIKTLENIFKIINNTK
jgi:cysteine desulfurase